MSVLFRKDIEPFCTYCARSTPLNKTHVSCKRYGIVNRSYNCRSFSYDPLKRVPAKPAKLRKFYDDKDLIL